ncbi:MAG: VanZ family protein [Candidatus Hydrothermarchaeales archaeon]
MKRLYWWLLLIVYAAFIFHLSSLEAPPTPPLFPHQDKVMHFAEYVPFGYLTLKAFAPVTLKGYSVSAFFALAYAASDEVHQGLVPTREPSFFDWLADATGILVAFALKLRGRITKH